MSERKGIVEVGTKNGINTNINEERKCKLNGIKDIRKDGNKVI